MSGFVYKWVDSSNDMYYIGSHKGTVDDGYIGSGTHFNRAYSKRPECFTRQILYIGEDYLELEEFILEELDAANDNMSYNLKNKALGFGSGENNPKFGKNKGKDNPRYGKTFRHTPESIEKIRRANRVPNSGQFKEGREAHNKTSVVEMTSGKIFDSVNAAALYYGVSQPTMTYIIQKGTVTKGKCKNLIFKKK